MTSAPNAPRRTCGSFAVALALSAGGLCSIAHAQQWTVINLHPAGATTSECRGVYVGQQAGVVDTNTANGGAVIWYGASTTVKSLNPVVPGQPSGGVTSSLGAYGVGGCNFAGHQGGTVSITDPSRGVGTFSHASLWNNTAASWVDLQPNDPTLIATGVFAVNGDTQVGSFNRDCGGTFCVGAPCLWHGTADSFVDLTPPGYGSGQVNGLFGNEQVGTTNDSFLGMAGLWHGTPDSFVNLQPADSPFPFSAATCTDGTHQYGTAGIIYESYGGLYPVQWTGSADSMVDLGVDDPTTQWGEVHACSGSVQVGYATDSNTNAERAAMWTGAPGTFLDLNQFLSNAYNGSNAEAVWQDPVSGTVYIGGYAYDAVTGNRQAIMWVKGPGVNLITSPAAPADCSVPVNGQASYSVRVLNAGPTTSGSVTLTVDLPPAAVATYASAVPAPTTVTATQLVFTLTPIAGAGAFTDVSINLTAHGSGATSTITAHATTAGEADPSNNTASASTRIQPTAPSTAPARAIFSTVPSQPNSLVPGGGGARFTQLNRPLASASGNWWVMTGGTDGSATQNLVLTRSQTGGAPSLLAQKGVTLTSQGILSDIDAGARVNDSGLVALAGRDNGPAATSRFVAKTSGGPLLDVARQGSPVPGMPGVSYDANVGASTNLFNNGQVAFSTETNPAGNQAYLSANGASVIARANVTIPNGTTLAISDLYTANFDGGTHGGINFDASGAHYVYECELNTEQVDNNDALVADGTLLIQEGQTLPGDTVPIDGISRDISVGPSGVWLIHGRDADDSAWVIRGTGSTIAQLIKGGDPIYAGSPEHWAQDTTHIGGGLTFFAQLADGAGNYIIGGTTDNPDYFANNVLVYNNNRVIARENDPVDLDGNGVFDDGVYIAGFNTLQFEALQDGVTFVHGGILTLVTLRDSTSALCHLGDTTLGQALVFIPISTCGTADFNCDGDIGTDQDIAAFFACLSGSCPSAPCPNSADFNGDGDTGTDADIEAFFRVLAGGAC